MDDSFIIAQFAHSIESALPYYKYNYRVSLSLVKVRLNLKFSDTDKSIAFDTKRQDEHKCELYFLMAGHII